MTNCGWGSVWATREDELHERGQGAASLCPCILTVELREWIPTQLPGSGKSLRTGWCSQRCVAQTRLKSRPVPLAPQC